MKKTFGIIAALVLVCANWSQAGGQITLFNGKDLTGWVQHPANGWHIADGAMASLATGGRGELYTTANYTNYRLFFTARHLAGGHYASALVFAFPPPLKDAMGAIQFGLPNGYHWDYRPGHNNTGGSLFTVVDNPGFSKSAWSRYEILVNATTGTARMAVANPVGTKAVEVLDFKDSTAGRTGPIAFQIHQSGTVDEYKDVSVTLNPKTPGLLSVISPQ